MSTADTAHALRQSPQDFRSKAIARLLIDRSAGGHTMDAHDRAASVSRRSILIGRVLSTLAVLFLVFDGVTKVIRVRQVVEATAELGYPEGSIPVVGVILLVCTVVYVIPRTAVLGTVLLTGYLGGAVAANLRVGHPLFQTAFPVLFAILIWAGMLLREERLRHLLPLRR